MKLKFSENVTKKFDEIFVFNLLSKGAFFNYVDKRRWVGNPKMSTFINSYKVQNVIVAKRKEIDGKKGNILST